MGSINFVAKFCFIFFYFGGRAKERELGGKGIIWARGEFGGAGKGEIYFPYFRKPRKSQQKTLSQFISTALSRSATFNDDG